MLKRLGFFHSLLNLFKVFYNGAYVKIPAVILAVGVLLLSLYIGTPVERQRRVCVVLRAEIDVGDLF